MKKYFLYLFIFFSLHFFSTYAQKAQSCRISGTLTDEEGNTLEFALVSLHQLPDSSHKEAIVTREDGTYLFDHLTPASYYLSGNLTGYGDVYSSAIILKKESYEKVVDLKMSTVALISKEVVIEGQKAMVQQEAGLTVVNIENSTMNAGLSAADAMKRVPGVTVDKDGQLKLKGKDGVMVMIDDKPLYLDAAQVGNLLKSLPADQVKQIEVMTSPSAKFDAAGTAGIINIKLKKGAYEGFDGTITNSYGHGLYAKGNSGINLSYRKNKLALNGSYQYNYRKNLQQFHIFRNYVTEISQDSSYNTSSKYTQPEHVNTVILGGSYDIGKKSTLNWDVNSILNNSLWKGGSASSITSTSGSAVSEFKTTEDSKDKSYNGGASVGFKQKFDTTGTELTSLFDFKTLDKKSFQNFTTVYSNPLNPVFNYQSQIPISLLQKSAKIDFTKIISGHFKIETGIKYNNIRTESKVDNTLGQANHFIYTENIYALYSQLGRSFGKWKLLGGLRMEHTNNTGDQRSIDSIFKRRYTNFFPSATISFAKSENTSYTFLYTRRVNRPNYESLNPFAYYTDPYSIYSGYPFLKPQYTQHLELTSSHFKGAFLTTIDYSYTSQPMSDVFIFDKNSLKTTYTKRNMVSFKNIGISFSVNTPVNKWWTTSNFLHLFNSIQTGDVGYGEMVMRRFSWSFNSTHTFKLPAKFAAEISGVYESPSFYGTNYYRSLWQVSVGVSKKILKERFTLKFSANDIFWKYYYQGEGTIGTIRTSDGYLWDNRVVMFTVSYHLRKSILSKEPEKSILEKNSGSGR